MGADRREAEGVSPDEQTLEREQLELLLRAGEILGSSLSIQEILDRLMDQVICVLGAERGFIWMRDGSEGQWRCRSARSIDPSALEGEDFRISRSVVDQVAREGLSVLTSDAHHDTSLRGYTSVGLYEMKSILCVPIVLRGETRGVAYADHRMHAGVFDAGDRLLLEAVARQAAIALENALLHEESMQRARQELAETQARLVHSSKLAAVGQLAAGVAHELNTPLGTIAVNVSALLPTAPENVRRRLELMERGVDRCRDIVDRLLTFSRRSTPRVGPVRLAPVIAETLALAGGELHDREICVQVQADEQVTVLAGATEVSQILLNLVLNARDALCRLPPGEPRRLVIRAFEEGDSAVLEVHDSGPGIAPDIRDRIFEPFFTTREVGEGVGLGLSITHELVQLFGGTIHLKSEPGRGASFTIRFPRGGASG